ncbi:MAG TPA: prepilin-type N-terminal cleavage/methylation domain-containing protein [Candidatus Saccharimonadales bacterium]|nr:prepilin-type N-terminal cleavage/methylation domain-containing protein [Candidatus Saccharimonadales bacterium]
MSRRMQGFTLLEMLLSLTIIAVLAGLSLPVYMRLQQAQDLDGSVQKVVDDLRRAQLYSRDGYMDSTWGVHVATGAVTIFQGNSFATRNSTYDEVKSLPGAIVITSPTDIWFSKLYAQPDTASIITLTVAGMQKTIQVNSYGMVDF